MSKMLAEIGRIINEDISNRVTQYDVLYEAITNAVHANAREVVCKFHSYDNPLNENGIALAQKKVDTISVIDDGEGFNDDNFNSFSKYRSEFKKALGGKGVGRFVFLKVYENVNFKSSLRKSQQQRTFKFDADFDTDNLITISQAVEKSETEVKLSSLTPQYYNTEKHLDRRIELDLLEIRERILFHLLPILFFYKKKGVSIKIILADTTTDETKEIRDNDIPDFLEKPFTVKDKDGKQHSFTLNHRVENINGNLYAFYCANNRTVCPFSDKDFNITLPYGYSGFVLLEAKYLDVHVNNERNDFDIFPRKTDLFSTLSWEMINSELKKIISDIVKEGVPETETINKEKIKEIQEERPYLVNYIDDDDIEIAGFLDKKHIIEKAKKKFDNAKEHLLVNAGKENYTDDELKEAIEITQNELVSYINDRAQVLERLRKLIDKKERVESVIHNLFMERHTSDDFFCIGKNNLWLIDDRFTSYSYAASDKRINDVLSAIGENAEEIDNINDKPDLSLFFSHNPDTPSRLKSVLVEIKPFEYSQKSDRKKYQGIQQLIDYVKAFKTKENIEEIFAFLITDIDVKLADRLTTDSYIPLYSTESPIYYRYYEKSAISIYVVSARTLIIDAEARNKIFLDIIRKQSKLNKLLNI